MKDGFPTTVDEAAARLTRCTCKVLNEGTKEETHTGWVRLPVPVGHPLFGKAIPCYCQRDGYAALEADRLRRMSNVPTRLEEEMRFETFRPQTDDQKAALSFCQGYARQPHGWLVLAGPVGVGKTHLAVATAVDARQRGRAVYWQSWPEILSLLKAGMDRESGGESTTARLLRLEAVELLLIDDLGAELSSEWSQAILFELLNARYNNRRPTIVTTNVDVQAGVQGRIWSRLLDGVSIEKGRIGHSAQPWSRLIVLGGEDYRKRRKAVEAW